MIYVVTAVHNRKEITRAFVDRLNQQTLKEACKLVLVDDGCTDGTAEMVREHYPNSVILSGDGNLWWGGAMDQALRWISKEQLSDEDVVFISNDDVDFPEDYIQRAVDKLRTDGPKTLLTGIGISENSGEYMTTPVLWNFRTGIGKNVLPGEYANCVATRSLFFFAKDISGIGFFHPILLPHYQSDYEWTMRAVKRGWTIKSYPDLSYNFDEKKCGFGNFRKLTFKQIFSKRSSCNPFYRLTFYMLSTDIRYWPSCLFHQIKRMLK